MRTLNSLRRLILGKKTSRPQEPAPHVISNIVLPGELVFDIGANAGNKTEWFLSKGARVVAVEPQSSMAHALRHRFPGHPNLTVVQKGLGDRRGHLVMNICSGANFVSTFSDEWRDTGRFAHVPWDQRETVEIVTLDDLIAEHGSPRYAKIDVEGFEKKVMHGLRSKSIDSLSLEFMTETLGDTIDLIQYAQGLGYSWFNFSMSEDSHFALSSWVDAKDIIARISEYCASDTSAWGDVYLC